MQSLSIILLSSILIQGALFSKFALRIRKQKTLSSIVICIISVVLLVHLVNIYIDQFSNLNIPFHVLPVAIVSYGPLIYMYVTSLSNKGFTLPRSVFYAFVPVVMVAIIHIVGHDNYHSWQHILFHVFIYMYSLVYLLISIVFVYKNLTRGKHEWSWTYHFLLLITFLIVFVALDYARFITSWDHLQNFTTAGVVWMGFIIVSTFLLQNLLYPSIFNKAQGSYLKDKKPDPRLDSTPEELQRVEKLNEYIEEFKPHLQHDLTLAKLSEQVKIPSHTLSSLINQHFQKSFLDLINGYRIERAKQLLRKSDLKILAVGLESGFSNKTTFNRTFRKFTGLAPSEFRNNLQS